MKTLTLGHHAIVVQFSDVLCPLLFSTIALLKEDFSAAHRLREVNAHSNALLNIMRRLIG